MEIRARGIEIVSLDAIEDHIYLVRGKRVMLDIHLADLYEVPAKRLKEQVNRNLARFPDDFMLRLTASETQAILASRSQIATLKQGANVKYGSYAFTEQGVAMLSGVLSSDRAVEVNIAIMRAFVRMRQILGSNQLLTRKLEEIEKKLISHDYKIGEILTVIRRLMRPPKTRRRFIGYRP